MRETLLSCCAGLDVHKETVEAHIRRSEPDGTLWQQTRQWGTMTADLQRERALEGKRTEHHRFLLRPLWTKLTHDEVLIAELDRRIEELTHPFALQREHQESIPGMQSRVAEVLLAEMGADVQPFPTARHLASWAGMCPGNDESAGQRHAAK